MKKNCKMKTGGKPKVPAPKKKMGNGGPTDSIPKARRVSLKDTSNYSTRTMEQAMKTGKSHPPVLTKQKVTLIRKPTPRKKG